LGNNLSLVRGAIVSSSKVLKAARDSKLLVIHTREGYRADLADLADCPLSKLTRGGKTFIGADGPMGRVLIRGEAGHDIIPELYPALGEPIIDKPGKGAFHETDLQLILQNHSIRTLIVCGVSTEASVTTTVREANDRGYECIIPADCVGSYFPEFQNSALDMIKAQGAMSGWVSDAAAIVDGLRG
jgi:biuret amidohydrolase